ncbi:MAG TPA: FAD-binding oxidoreductase [candidate division Zixibacteria bacterium]|nr:FAD-binding oxidoreductase [candidate division Zixibacteria bacterium]
MSKLNEFVEMVRSVFPDDRITWQKSVPTFHPESADEAAALIKLAGQHSQPLFISGFCNNIEPSGESFREVMAIKTDRLNTVGEINENDLYITIGAGYPLREINRCLITKRLMLPHSNLPYVGSVGGAVAVGLKASLHEQPLPLSRYLLKAQIVTAAGEIIKPGSVCFKSVSGYDIVKIFAGSWGLLGLIVSATFRVMPTTAADDYAPARQLPVDRQNFLSGLSESSNEADVVYSRKIKAKFDPATILPILG